MKLFTASASPFANKVRMAAQLAGIDLEPVAINAAEEPTELTSANPLGKIPCLVLDNGKAVYDSRAITRHLHYRFETSLYPDDSKPEAADVAVFEALCDGICDCAVAWQYETRLRPEEKVHQPWLDKQWGTTIPVKHAHYMKQKADSLQAHVQTMIIKNAGHNWRRVEADIDPTREVIIDRTIQFFIQQLAR